MNFNVANYQEVVGWLWFVVIPFLALLTLFSTIYFLVLIGFWLGFQDCGIEEFRTIAPIRPCKALVVDKADEMLYRLRREKVRAQAASLQMK